MSDDGRLALARGVIARLLGIALAPPGDATLEELFSQRARRVLARAALIMDGGEAGPVGAAAKELASLPAPSLQELRRVHLRIFGHTPRGKVCPYETEYGREEIFQQAHELADIAGFYRAFGLKPAPEDGERPDHIACELEFLAFLSLKEAYAIEKADEEMLEITKAAAKKFLRDHAGAFGRAFAAALEREDPGGPYGASARLCAAFLTTWCAQAGVPAGPEYLSLRPEMPDAVPMACGAEPDLIQIQHPRSS